MKTLLVGINAKFIHSNLAIRYIREYASGQGVPIDTVEYTINQSLDLVLDGILKHQPDLVGFSCYLWNIEMVRKLAVMLNQVKPSLKILLGGPEVSYDTLEMMKDLPQIDYIIAGEGEVTVTKLVTSLIHNESLVDIKGLTYRDCGQVVKNPAAIAMDMSDVPFVYEEGLTGLEHKILYYETSRGCPYKCQYCLSSIEKDVRFRPIEMVEQELRFFLDAKVTQVKFVDRTFNAKKAHTWAIWRYLHDHDNGVTNFHFEITADLLDEETIDFLAGVRPGLFQFEVGVQSTHKATIVTIERKVEFETLKAKVLKVMEGGNIHMHLDLIAGLPKEDYPTFRKSFNDVMAIRPEQLQLGFLKVLKGSRIHQLQKSYGIVYRAFAPYEVLSTNEMTYEDLRKLKAIEDLLETYYNSGQFTTAIEYLMTCHESPFDCFEQMADYWQDHGWFDLPHNKLRLYDLIYDYTAQLHEADSGCMADLLKHDLCMREKPKKWPSFVDKDAKVSRTVIDFYQNELLEDSVLSSYKGLSSKQKTRLGHLEKYDSNVMINGPRDQQTGQWLFYDYRAKNIMTGNATVTDVTEYIK